MPVAKVPQSQVARGVRSRKERVWLAVCVGLAPDPGDGHGGLEDVVVLQADGHVPVVRVEDLDLAGAEAGD